MVLRISQVFYVFKQYQKLKINASYYVYVNFISNIHFDIADMKKKNFYNGQASNGYPNNIC